MKKTLFWHIQQLLLTLTDQPSFYSGKRIERLAIFVTVISSANAYIWSRLNESSFTAAEFMIVSGGLLTYAGFNTIQGKKTNTTDEQTNNISGNLPGTPGNDAGNQQL